jgi:hypothetical protein
MTIFVGWALLEVASDSYFCVFSSAQLAVEILIGELN